MRALRIEPTRPAHQHRGPLLSPEGAAKLFPPEAAITPDWCRRHIRPRVKLGRKVLFYQADVLAFIEKHREDDAA